MTANIQQISMIYTGWGERVPETVKDRLDRIIDSELKKKGSLEIFFRADDIGPLSANFTRMMALFVKYRVALNLAVVPAWMTRPRWEAMSEYTTKDLGDIFCWHMHGYQHKNHETEGKKQEFGPSRNKSDICSELSKGARRLEKIMGNHFYRLFTPPWNRCSSDTMVCLKEMDFSGISRSSGSRPEPPDGLRDFPVMIDLHTRKEAYAEEGWDKLIEEFSRQLATAPCGIMLHHMRMNDAAFVFLEYLLEIFSNRDGISIVTYRDLV